MGDDSSPTTDSEEQTDQIDVDAAPGERLDVEAEYTDQTAPPARSGLLAMRFDEILGFIGFTFLLGVAVEFGKRVGRDLYRSHY